jgi:hypothetical protein
MQFIQVIVIKIKRLAYRLIGLACAAGRTRKVRQRPPAAKGSSFGWFA